MSPMTQYQQNDDSSEDLSQVEATADEIEEVRSVNSDELRERQLEMIDIAQTTAEQAFDFARELASAKTPFELMALCMTHAQKQFAASAEQAAEMTDVGPKMTMPTAYIEARPKGRQEDALIDDFVVEDDVGRVLVAFDTQMEAIVWAKDNGHIAQVARHRDRNDKKNPDHWRSF
jgi:phasin protein